MIRRHPERAVRDRAAMDRVLAEALVCHVAFDDAEGPVVVPMTYAPFEGGLVLHGARHGRIVERLASGAPVSVAVTVLDGLVLARSAMHHSMNYRSVVAFGRCREITEPGRKRAALDALMDHVAPGRRDLVRAPSEAELAVTGVVWFPLDEASMKARSGPPLDADADLGLPHWAGVLPLRTVAGPPERDPTLAAGVQEPDHVTHWRRPEPGR